MSYKDYQNARDSAWRILLDCGIDRLPVDLNPICKHLGVRVVRYSKAGPLLDLPNLSKAMRWYDGLAFYADELPVILYNDACSPERIRFTVAHELGHIILAHVKPEQGTTANREPPKRNDPIEVAANQFAARLLAPACVLWGMQLHTAEEIASACFISKQAAEFRAARMEDLYRRNRFLTSPLEQEVFQRFKPFIKEETHHHPVHRLR